MPTSSSLPRRSGAHPGTLTLAALAAAGTALLAVPAAVAAPGDNGDVTVRIEDADAPVDPNQPGACEFYLEAASFDVVPGLAWTIEPQPARSGAAQLSGHLTLAAGEGRTDGTMALPEGQYKLTWRTDGGMGAGKQKFFKVDCRNETPAAGPDSEGQTEPGTEQDAGPDKEQEAAEDTGRSAERNVGRDAERNGGQDTERGAERNSGQDADRNADRNAGPDMPNGGPPAGGGGLAQPQGFGPLGGAPVAGMVAAGLVAVGGAAYFRLRRRADGAA
ncbi:hypothetical protein ACFS5L_13910 [Streptomyces phyllanthi]|uniref:LPXTG cell wall anchor domain-containing protein n=1 Tax=Streptomyces phyllanthi TaxID=1803180 RepID=A0A5N8W7T3_9ACTN|nr:hypothetical protein [Streptomyces phyllanthi]MPY43530.1 hypothetical protein [Streptomyces phyllanthi]